MEEDTKIKEVFEKDIDNMVEHINLVIEAHNKLVDKYAELQQKINKAIEYNEKVSKENWYGGYEKEIATKNINLLQGKSDE